MKKPKTIKKDTLIPFTDIKGHTVYIDGNLTVGEAYKLGIKAIEIQPRNTPKKPKWYYHEPKRNQETEKSGKK